MKHSLQFMRHSNNYFHMPAASNMFSLVATFLFALFVMLALLVVSAR